MLVMSTSVANDVIEEYEDQFNIEWGEWGGGKVVILGANVQSKGRKGACTFTFHKFLAKIVRKRSINEVNEYEGLLSKRSKLRVLLF